MNDTNVISYISYILNRYNKDRKLLDKMGIDEVIKALISINGLEDYIKKINYIPLKNEKANMAYSYFNKSINISPDFISGIKRTPIEVLSYYKIESDTVTINLDIVHAILHEVNHANQYKFIDNTDNKLLKDILLKSLAGATYKEAGNKDNAIKFAEKTNELKIYQLMPSELNAEIEALKQTRNIIDSLNVDKKYRYINMYDIQIKLLEMNSYKKNWIFITSPVEQYVKYRRKYMKDNIELNREEIFKLDLDIRLSYGLPITLFEYNNMKNEIKSDAKYFINLK